MMDDTRLEQFGAYLTSIGKKLTRARVTVATAAFASGPVVDHERLVAELRDIPDGERVSRAAVFRILGDLETLGLVRVRPGDF